MLIPLIAVLAWQAGAMGAEIVVEPGGEIAKARDAVRKLIADGLKADVTVLIKGGTYELPEPLVFGPEDSGTEQFSITYAAAPGERVILSGGRRITGWTKGEGELWTAKLPDTIPRPIRNLWVNDRRAVRARFPNEDDNPSRVQLQDSALAKDLRTWTMKLAPGTVKDWQNPADIEITVDGDWEISRKRVASIDPATATLTLAPPHRQSIPWNQPRKGRWAYLEGSPSFLDRPGEWCYESAAGVLKYWPLPGEDMAKVEVFAPTLTQIVVVKGATEKPVRNLHFKGITFAHTHWQIPDVGYLGVQACHIVRGQGQPQVWDRVPCALRFDFAHGCSVRDGAIAHLGTGGIELVEGCRNCTIEGNHVHDISANGVMLGGPKDEAGVPKDCRVANNHVHAIGTEYHGAVAIWVGFAQRALIAHNEIHDTPYTGISLGWQWNPQPTPARENIIEWNHVYDVMKHLGDGGCIYTLGFQPGTQIRFNHLHDVRRSPFNQGAPNNGMFIDEGSKGFHFERNVIYRTAHQPVRFNQCAREWHTWKDNVEGGIAAPVPGKVGSALACDGSSSFIEVPHKPELEPEELTIEAWLRLDEFPAGNDPRRWLVNKNRNEWEQGHYALIIQGDKVGAYLNIGGGKENHFLALSSESVLKLKEWQHVAMTYDGAELRVYHNGTQVASAAINKKRVPGRLPLAIGRRQDAYNYFKGAIDEVRLYNRALPADELRAHFEKPASAAEAKGVVASWPFDDLDKLGEAVKEVIEKAGLQPAYRGKLEGR